MGINSRQTYRLLKDAAAPWLKRSTMRWKVRDGLWVCQYDEGWELSLRFQCNKYGWMWDGSTFTLNFGLADTLTKRKLLGCRYGALLDAEDGETWIEMTNEVISKIRELPQPPLQDWEYPEWRERDLAFEDGFIAESDPWLRFYDEHDVRTWWLRFLEPRIDAMLARFLKLGGSQPTPDYPMVSIPSLAVDVDDDDYSVFRMGQRDSLTLAKGLEKVLSDRSPGVMAKHADATFVFDRLARTGVVEDELLGIERGRRVWASFGEAALAQLIEMLRNPPGDEPVTLGKSARIRLHVALAARLVP